VRPPLSSGNSTSTGSRRSAWPLALVASLFLFPAVAGAGDIAIEWDPVPDADLAGYVIYVGTDPGDLRPVDATEANETSKVITGLPDCTDLHIGVKAVDFGGLQSLGFSDLVTGMTQPSVTTVTPSQFDQGVEAVTVSLEGGSFTANMQRADLEFDDPDIRVLDLYYVSCAEIEVDISVGPFLSNPGDPWYNGSGDTVEEVAPAYIGPHDLTLFAPDDDGVPIQGSSSSVVTVELVPSRTDTDGTGRVDGFDLARLARSIGASQAVSDYYEPGLDFDGNKFVDGEDQTVLGNFFGCSVDAIDAGDCYQ
jgi:hypothetical protein